MTDDSKNGSGTPASLSAEEERAIKQQMLEMMTQDIFNMLSVQEPDTTKQARLNASSAAAQEHMQLGGFMAQRLDMARTNVWGVQITDPAGRQARLGALKRFEECKTPEQALATALVFALTTSPYARAVLHAQGWRIDFLEIKQEKKSPIIMPGS